MTGPTLSSAAPQDRYAEAIEHHQAGRVPEATSVLCEIIAAEPGHHPALHQLGLLMHQNGAHEQAAALIEHAIAIDGSIAGYHYNLSVIQLALGHAEDAVRSCRQAVALNPDLIAAHINLATTLNNLGRPDEALAAAERAVSLDPASLAARIAAGTVLIRLDRLDEAESQFRQARQIEPRSIDALINLGGIAFAREHFADAAALYREALSLEPANAGAHSNLAGALRLLGRTEEALGHYEQALALGFPHAETRLNRSFLLLALGRYEAGWPAYEVRHEMAPDGTPSDLPPVWRGEDLRGKTLLLRAEQGYGDAIQFCRYAAPLAALGGRIFIQAKAPLLRLLGTVPGAAAVIADNGPVPAADYHLPMMSAPYRLGTTLQTVPAVIPYLRADPAAAADWRAVLSGLPGLKVGLVWAGERRNAADAHRSIALAEMAPMLRVPGVSFVSLQIDPDARRAIAALPPELRPVDRMDAIRDFADTAALIEALDLVISVDTSVAHLAGALGKPVWLLHRQAGCWRWLLERGDSPWYPTMRVFRQRQLGDWSEAIAGLAAELERLAADSAKENGSA